MLLASTRSWEFQSTHPLRGATCYFFLSIPFPIISIHAPLAGCDLLPPLGHDKLLDFNPRTPCGVRRILCRMAARKSRFQSTHPLRGATFATILDSKLSKFQSTHPLRGATESDRGGAKIHLTFQSTHPLRGATRYICFRLLVSRYFNPRTPCGVRLQPSDNRQRGVSISIHAPLAGCDGQGYRTTITSQNFNPRTPCGVRR